MSSNLLSDSPAKIRLGVVGAGGHATHQIYPCLHSLPVELAAVCDLDRTRAIHNAQIFGAKATYTSSAEMLNDASLDAVLICVGANQHSKLAIETMEAGLPVWTEKPPAASAAETQAMLDVSHNTGQICMTGFMKRFAPVYRRVREAIDSADFGSPHLLAIDWSFGVSSKAWLNMFLLDFGIHMIDLSRFMFGEVADVYARERDGRSYAVTMAFINGAVGTLSMTANRGLDITEEIILTGEYGHTIKVDSTGRMIRYHGNDVIDWYDRPLALQDSLTDIGYLGALWEFIAALQERREPESSIVSSSETMRLYEAINRSAGECRVVTLTDV